MKRQIAVIVEGDRTEVNYWKAIEKAFFSGKQIQVIHLPIGKNLYMLWKKMVEDDFETDIIEVIKERFKEVGKKMDQYNRDDFQEVYLFFDYDPHQHNLSEDGTSPEEVIAQMLEAFDNETENGKLYISYPMSEALRDITDMSCKPNSHCLISMVELRQQRYKSLSGEKNTFNYFRSYTEQTWNMIIAIFIKRCACLFNYSEEDSELLAWIKSKITPDLLYQRERELLVSRGKIFVLSAFPEFLLDYFQASRFENSMALVRSISSQTCTEKWMLR